MYECKCSSPCKHRVILEGRSFCNKGSNCDFFNYFKVNHSLKIQPEYFKDVSIGLKCFELRVDDRNFKVGDSFILWEYNGEIMTGRYFKGVIKYVLRDCPQFGLQEGYCIFGW